MLINLKGTWSTIAKLIHGQCRFRFDSNAFFGLNGKSPTLGNSVICARPTWFLAGQLYLRQQAANSAIIASCAAAARSRSRRNSASCHSIRSSMASRAAIAADSAACWRALARVNNIPQATAFPRALGPMPCARRQRSERKRARPRGVPMVA